MQQQLKQVFGGILRISPETVHDDLTPDQVPEWDSLHHLNLIVTLEETFDLSFTPDEMNDMRRSFGAIRKLVETKVGKG